MSATACFFRVVLLARKAPTSTTFLVFVYFFFLFMLCLCFWQLIENVTQWFCSQGNMQRAKSLEQFLSSSTVYQELPKRAECQHTVNEWIKDTNYKVFIRSAIWSSPPNLHRLTPKNSSSWHRLKMNFHLAISIATCYFSGQHARRSQALLYTGCVQSDARATSARLPQNKAWYGFQL